VDDELMVMLFARVRRFGCFLQSLVFEESGYFAHVRSSLSCLSLLLLLLLLSLLALLLLPSGVTGGASPP
jgi:hypothetical protein